MQIYPRMLYLAGDVTQPYVIVESEAAEANARLAGYRIGGEETQVSNAAEEFFTAAAEHVATTEPKRRGRPRKQ